MWLPMNLRQIATVTMVCSALVAAGVAPALARNDDRHDKPGHHQKLNKYWWGYLYEKVEALTRSLGTLGGRVTYRLNHLSTRVDELAATVAGQANASLAASIAQLTSDLAKVSGDLTLLSAKVEPMSIKLDQMNTRLELKVAEFTAGIESVTRSVGRLDGLVGSLTGRVEDLERARVAGGGRSVVDVNGTKVGDFVGYDPLSWAPLVGISDQNHSFVLRVAQDVAQNGVRGDTGLSGDTVFFAEPDCLGAAYVAPVLDNGDTRKALSMAGVKKDNINRVYFVYATPANQDLNRNGFDVWSVARNGGGCQTFFELSNSGPALNATLQLQLPVAGPYRVN